MAHVVFLRAANVGGHRVFQPAAFARELSELGVVNVGAAGTFVVRASKTEAAIRRAFTQKLPFAADLMICPERDILGLPDVPDFAVKPPEDTKLYLTVMASAVRPTPRLPLLQPDGGGWCVKIIATHGRYVLSLNRRMGKRLYYPNELVEKSFGQPATTRNWTTVIKLVEILSQ
jgi:uncharacterized protein (DUF1697 family)